MRPPFILPLTQQYFVEVSYFVNGKIVPRRLPGAKPCPYGIGEERRDVGEFYGIEVKPPAPSLDPISRKEGIKFTASALSITS